MHTHSLTHSPSSMCYLTNKIIQKKATPPNCASHERDTETEEDRMWARYIEAHKIHNMNSTCTTLCTTMAKYITDPCAHTYSSIIWIPLATTTDWAMFPMFLLSRTQPTAHCCFAVFPDSLRVRVCMHESHVVNVYVPDSQWRHSHQVTGLVFLFLVLIFLHRHFAQILIHIVNIFHLFSSMLAWWIFFVRDFLVMVAHTHRESHNCIY